jgi:hypothetical protein
MNQAAKSKKAAKKQPAKSDRKATVRAQARHVAPKKERASKAAIPPIPRTGREGSKTTKILELLRRDGGATLADLMQATEWQAHSVRGFLSGTLRKKMKLNVQLEKSESGDKSYSILS